LFLSFSQKLIKNSLWMSGAHSSRLLLHAAYFIVLTRSLGPEGLGIFAAALSLINIFIPFSSWGSGNILVMHVSRENKLFSVYWGNALMLTFLTGIVLIPLTFFCGKLFAPTGAGRFVMIVFYTAIGEFLFYRISEIAGQAFQATEQLKNTALLLTMVSCCRLLAALGFTMLVSNHSVLVWSQWYLAANFLSGLLSFALVSKMKGRPSWSWEKARENLGDGFFFSTGIAAKSIYTDCDKIFLARMALLDAAGYYAAAYSIISFAFTPIQAMLAASYPLFFQAGSRGGVNETFLLSKKLFPFPLLYGCVVAASLFLGAPVLPFILGERFAGAVEIVRWLAIVPFLQALHYLLADALTGAGLQRLRSAAQAVTAGFNIGLNFYLIPLYSWKGAAIATLMSETCLAIFLFVTIMYIKREQQVHITPQAML